MAGLLRLIEHREPSLDTRRIVIGRPFVGGILGPGGQSALAARWKPPALSSLLVWEWPDGLELPLGHLRPGVRAVPACPGENSLLDFGDGITWRCQQLPALTSPPPEWLIAALQPFVRVSEEG